MKKLEADSLLSLGDISKFLRSVLWDSTAVVDTRNDTFIATSNNSATIRNNDNTTKLRSDTVSNATLSENTTNNIPSTDNSAYSTATTIGNVVEHYSNNISSVDIPIGDALFDKLTAIFSIAQVL